MTSPRLPSPRLSLWLLILVSVSLLGPVHGRESLYIGFAQDTLGNDWRLAQVMEVKQTLAEYPQVRFEYTDAQGSTALQAKHIEDLVNRGVDLLITSPRDRHVLSQVIERVHAQGIPVILLSRGIEGEGYTSFIHPGNLAIGRAAGEYLAQRLEGKGRVLMLEGVPGASTTLYRTRGFLEAVADYPGIMVERRVGNYLRADAIRATESVLESGKHIDAIYAQSDSMALAAMMVLRRYGIDPSSLPIVGIDYISESREAIRRGDLAVSFTYPTGGREGAMAAMELLQGKPVPKEIPLDSVRVTRDNVEQVEPIF
ncbi:MAG: substrate-binding domain-containing protein [Candidatus Thiodiazotropha sp.]